MKTLIKSLLNETKQDNIYSILGFKRIKEQNTRLWLENITTFKM